MNFFPDQWRTEDTGCPRLPSRRWFLSTSTIASLAFKAHFSSCTERLPRPLVPVAALQDSSLVFPPLRDRFMTFFPFSLSIRPFACSQSPCSCCCLTAMRSTVRAHLPLRLEVAIPAVIWVFPEKRILQGSTPSSSFPRSFSRDQSFPSCSFGKERGGAGGGPKIDIFVSAYVHFFHIVERFARFSLAFS